MKEPLSYFIIRIFEWLSVRYLGFYLVFLLKERKLWAAACLCGLYQLVYCGVMNHSIYRPVSFTQKNGLSAKATYHKKPACRAMPLIDLLGNKYLLITKCAPDTVLIVLNSGERSRPVVLSRGWFCPRADIWRCLETLVDFRSYLGGVKARCSWTSYSAQDSSPHNRELSVVPGLRNSGFYWRYGYFLLDC